jgi:hypothetical protein
LPCTGEPSTEATHAVSCRAHDAAALRIPASASVNRLSLGRDRTTASIERTSPAEPRAMARKLRSSLVVTRPNPSAMLFETESATRSSWLRKPGESGRAGVSRRSSTRL